MNASVLIVEDSPTQLEALRGLLESAGIPAITAQTGEEALEITCSQRPELVLSDVVMPGMSGFELCRRIKEALGDRGPAVVLLTSLADPRDIVRGLEAGADNYITKPYQADRLIGRIRWILENRALRREGQPSEGLRIRFMGEEFTVTAVPQQMLEMLLASFEELARANHDLRKSREALAAASARELEQEQRARSEAEESARVMERLAREAEAATRARDDMLATVSHDLRNPLGTIYTSASLLLDIPLEEDQRLRQLQIIRRTADRAGKLIQDLLDVSRMEAGHFSVSTHPVPVSSLIEDARETLGPLASSQGIELVGEPPTERVRVLADIERIQRVLSNLVGNAVKFTPAGGTVTIRAEAEGGVCAFSVADEGPGIPENDLERIFDRYWQAERGAAGGAGLGLAIARGIVEAHGGRIWADNGEEKGAVFHFTLPLAE